VQAVFRAQLELFQQASAIVLDGSEERASLQSVQLFIEGAVLFGESCGVADQT
jgi:hypothetical protein